MNDGDVQLGAAAGTLFLILMLASLTAFVGWIRRWAKQGYVLAYQPRSRTPWGPLAGMLAVLMTLLGVLQAAAMRGTPPQDISPETFAAAQWQMSLLEGGLAVAILASLIFITGASRRDLGLPRSLEQAVADISLGLWMGLALMVPLYLLQLVSILVLGIPASHPLLNQMAETPNVPIFIAAMLVAVVVAPVFEELVFRLLLQGGLERWEDRQVGWIFSLPMRASHDELEQLQHESQEPPQETSTIEPTAETAGEHHEHSFTHAAGEELWDEVVEPDQLPAMPPIGLGVVPGLGHGWGPILASSFLFALAHLGNGPSPIPLFVFAMFLGYAYQRTHRILPCIVAHVLVNLTSITMMILQLSAT